MGESARAALGGAIPNGGCQLPLSTSGLAQVVPTPPSGPIQNTSSAPLKRVIAAMGESARAALGGAIPNGECQREVMLSSYLAGLGDGCRVNVATGSKTRGMIGSARSRAKVDMSTITLLLLLRYTVRRPGPPRWSALMCGSAFSATASAGCGSARSGVARTTGAESGPLRSRIN